MKSKNIYLTIWALFMISVIAKKWGCTNGGTRKINESESKFLKSNAGAKRLIEEVKTNPDFNIKTNSKFPYMNPGSSERQKMQNDMINKLRMKKRERMKEK